MRLLPGRRFQEWVIKNHNKDPARYADAPYAKDALTKLIAFVGDFPVLGQDFVNNDLFMINEHLDFLGMPKWMPRDLQDLLDWSGRKGLENVAIELGLDYGNTHDALDDACVTMQAYEIYKKR